MGETGFADSAYEFGDVGQVLAGAIEAGFSVAKPAAQPEQGEAGVILSAAYFQHDTLACFGEVKSGGGEEVVFDGLFARVSDAFECE